MEGLKARALFIDEYAGASNAASGSQVDANANVTLKSMASLEAELYKPFTIELNRQRVKTYMTEDVAKTYQEDLDNHLIYTHDESSLKPYCASVSMYPFLLEGTKCMGGVSGAPKNLQAFCGSFVNFVYQVAADYAGAVATVEFLHYFDYFARKSYGAFYLDSHRKEVEQELQGVVYALNQPASARGHQSVFWNISVFDKPYFDSMFGEFFYPDGTQPEAGSVMRLQKFFLEWFRKERRKELLTFPVVTASHLINPETKEYLDKDFQSYCAFMMSQGLSFFIYVSDSPDSLASCCRLRNELADNTFSYSLGAGGVVTGSAQVITLNLYRLSRMFVDDHSYKGDFEEYMQDAVKRIHSYLKAHKAMYKYYIDQGLLPSYTAGIMDLEKQFLTIGLNGIVETAEYVQLKVGDNVSYKCFLERIMKLVSEENKRALAETGIRFNTEFVPAENLGVKFAKWDRETYGDSVKSECYNSYFYRPESDLTSILDKFVLYGSEVTKYLDGGSALHLNLGHLPDFEQACKLYELAAANGVPYWTTNTLSTCCNDCGKIDFETHTSCPSCGSKNIDYATRIIGYLKRISNFSEARQKEAGIRKYHNVYGRRVKK